MGCQVEVQALRGVKRAVIVLKTTTYRLIPWCHHALNRPGVLQDWMLCPMRLTLVIKLRPERLPLR